MFLAVLIYQDVETTELSAECFQTSPDPKIKKQSTLFTKKFLPQNLRVLINNLNSKIRTDFRSVFRTGKLMLVHYFLSINPQTSITLTRFRNSIVSNSSCLTSSTRYISYLHCCIHRYYFDIFNRFSFYVRLNTIEIYVLIRR